MKYPIKVLFICYGNLTRSVMAEYFCNLYGRRELIADSAGTHYTLRFNMGKISPYFRRRFMKTTVRIMREEGIDVSGHRPKHIEKTKIAAFDVLVNMSPVPSQKLLDDYSPHFQGELIEWNIIDPHGKSDAVYRTIRREIKEKVLALIERTRENSA